MIIINFKNYKLGNKALKLARKIEKYLPNSIICPAVIDIEEISKKTKLKLFAQSADPIDSERATGFNTIKALKEAGAKGILVNHSEHPLSLSNILKIISLSKKLGMNSIVCIPSLKNLSSIKNKKPWAIAFEDPKLISTKKSIIQYAPKAIENFVKALSRTKIIPICGAGINSAEDVKQAYSLGCKGVLIASAIANVKNPDKLLSKLK